jgi:methylated-DNA-[protein]-cysteine S-methyltransferase
MSMLRLKPEGFAFFDTAIGRCGIAWTERGVCGVQIPEGDEASTRARLLRRWPDTPEETPPPGVADVIDRCVALMEGEAVDFADCQLDLRGTSEFERQVYAAALAIPPGQTLTYGEIADQIGSHGAARAVGAALGANPVPIVVPCHRVTGANGRSGGFSAPGGAKTKLRMLAIERGGAPTPEGQLL